MDPDKFERCVTSIPFMDHLLTSDGLKSDPAKVSTILDMPEVTDVAAIHHFTGTRNYTSPSTCLTCPQW